MSDQQPRDIQAFRDAVTHGDITTVVLKFRRCTRELTQERRPT